MQIGWAVADVTPDEPVILRGQFHSRISKSVHDPLLATALALETENAHAIIMSCDRVSIPGALEARVADALRTALPDVDPTNLIISATHTHTAPETEDGVYPDPPPGVMAPTDYADFLVERLAAAAISAWRNRTVGGVSWAYSHAVVGHNRRVVYAGGMARMYGETNQPDFDCVEGYEDHGVDILFTWNPQKELTGIIVNLACPSQVTEGEEYVSADFWHEVRQEFARRYGADVRVLPQCAAAGDQSPHLLLHKPEEALMRQRRGLSEREEIARRIANAVADALEPARGDIAWDPPLAHMVREVNLPVRMVTRAEYDEAKRQLEHWEAQQPDPANLFDTSYRFVMLRRYGRTVSRYETQSEAMTYPAPVHVVRLGDVAFATNPFELFLDYGLRIKARSPATQTFVVQLAGTGANTASGYLATARAVAARSYGAEVADNVVGPEGGQVLVDRTVEIINALWE
ncbi:MAG: hypothetical protein HPY69_09875 [Armatimonadetes bacterium]|nr:hypothetical protein [Armatimonadota bacterium]